MTKQETIPSGVLGNEVNIEGKGGSGTNNIKVKISGNHLFTKNYMQCIYVYIVIIYKMYSKLFVTWPDNAPTRIIINLRKIPVPYMGHLYLS